VCLVPVTVGGTHIRKLLVVAGVVAFSLPAIAQDTPTRVKTRRVRPEYVQHVLNYRTQSEKTLRQSFRRILTARGTFRTCQPRQPMSGFGGKAAVPQKSSKRGVWTRSCHGPSRLAARTLAIANFWRGRCYDLTCSAISCAAAARMSSGIEVACRFSRSRSTHLNSVLIAILPVATFFNRW
jgi:hypothetical protein